MAVASAGAISYSPRSLWWSGVPGWVLTLVASAGHVVADFGDRTVRLTAPIVGGAGCTFSAVTLTARGEDEAGDENRTRFLDVLGLCDGTWDRSEFLEWSLTDVDTTTYLAGKGTTPSHAVVWVRGSGSVSDLVDVHRRADAVGWVLPADVFETHHGSWLAALARREGVFQSVDRWFEKSYARHVVDCAGIPRGPAAEWCNMGRDPESLIWVQQQLVAAGTGLDVVWRQHKAKADDAWHELKQADSTVSKQEMDAPVRRRLMAAWVARWTALAPYGT